MRPRVQDRIVQGSGPCSTVHYERLSKADTSVSTTKRNIASDAASATANSRLRRPWIRFCIHSHPRRLPPDSYLSTTTRNTVSSDDEFTMGRARGQVQFQLGTDTQCDAIKSLDRTYRAWSRVEDERTTLDRLGHESFLPLLYLGSFGIPCS